jgi:hypothetical protein
MTVENIVQNLLSEQPGWKIRKPDYYTITSGGRSVVKGPHTYFGLYKMLGGMDKDMECTNANWTPAAPTTRTQVCLVSETHD